MDSDDVAKSSLDAPEKINCSNDLFSDQSDRSENLSTPEHKTNDDPTEPIKGLFDIDGECDDKLVNIISSYFIKQTFRLIMCNSSFFNMYFKFYVIFLISPPTEMILRSQ